MLAKDWYEFVISPGVDCSKPGVYRWQIEGAGVYVGKYTRIRRPTKEYRRNVARILKALPSHHPDGRFRRVQHALAEAVKAGRRITLTILVNAEPLDLNRREQEFISFRECQPQWPRPDTHTAIADRSDLTAPDTGGLAAMPRACIIL
jgi:hypothetical protein